MNMQAIQVFVTVAEELNFSRAAEKLFVTQPAITRQIQQLERELGTTLLLRNRHQVSLTPAGSACLPVFRQMLGDSERIRRIARCFDTDVQGEVRTAYPNITTLSLLSSAMEKLKNQHPMLKLQPVKVPALHLIASLDEGTASMTIAFHEMIRHRTDVSYVLLRHARMCALVPSNHELAKRSSLDYATLQSYSLILHEMSDDQLKMTGMMAELGAHGIDYYACRRERSAENILLATAAGEGIGLMPDGFLCYRVDHLLALPVVDSALENDVVLTWLTVDTSPAIRAIVQAVEKSSI